MDIQNIEQLLFDFDALRSAIEYGENENALQCLEDIENRIKEHWQNLKNQGHKSNMKYKPV